MATQNNVSLRTMITAADLSTKQFYCVKVDSAGLIALCAAAGEAVFGVLQDKPESGRAGAVAVGGAVKVIAGGNVAAGAKVKTDANGKAVTATAATVNTANTGAASDAVVGSYVFGTALVAGVSGDIITVELTHEGLIPTTAA